MAKKQHVNSSVDLNTLCGGAFAEKINEALVQVGENIQNMNTDATKKRKITITMTFAPNKTRQLVNTQIGVTTTLAATEAIDTQMVMGVNLRTGQLEIAEYDGQIRGQMSINDIIEQPERQHQDPEQQAPAETAEPDATPAGKPINLKNRGKANKTEPENGATAPDDGYEEDFDPETGEIFPKIVSMNKAAQG